MIAPWPGRLPVCGKLQEIPANIEISDLVVLAQAMGEYIRQDSIDGWLYTIGDNGEHLPWLVTDIAFQEASNAPPCVAVYMTANSIPTRKDV